MTTILLVEDDEAITEEISDVLRYEGYEVHVAGDGLAALSAMADAVPDLVICDMMMPRLGGMGVLAAVRDDPHLAHLPFIFLTARTAREDCRGAMTAGADDFLTKPFTLLELLGTVRARLERFHRAPAASPSRRPEPTRPANRRQAVTRELQQFLEGLRATAAAADRSAEFTISLAPRLFRVLPPELPELVADLLHVTLPHTVRHTPIELMAYIDDDLKVIHLATHQSLQSPLHHADSPAAGALRDWQAKWRRALAGASDARWHWEDDHSLHVVARWPVLAAAPRFPAGARATAP